MTMRSLWLVLVFAFCADATIFWDCYRRPYSYHSWVKTNYKCFAEIAGRRNYVKKNKPYTFENVL